MKEAPRESRMIDVTDKKVTLRTAVASARVRMKPGTLRKIMNDEVEKGNVFEVARIAAIQAAKQTGNLIPMCHPLELTGVEIEFSNNRKDMIEVRARVKVKARTGVEMEAMIAAAVAGLTIYDMCKNTDRGMVVEEIRLLKKSGGRSGNFKRSN